MTGITPEPSVIFTNSTDSSLSHHRTLGKVFIAFIQKFMFLFVIMIGFPANLNQYKYSLPAMWVVTLDTTGKPFKPLYLLALYSRKYFLYWSPWLLNHRGKAVETDSITG